MKRAQALVLLVAVLEALTALSVEEEEYKTYPKDPTFTASPGDTLLDVVDHLDENRRKHNPVDHDTPFSSQTTRLSPIQRIWEAVVQKISASWKRLKQQPHEGFEPSPQLPSPFGSMESTGAIIKELNEQYHRAVAQKLIGNSEEAEPLPWMVCADSSMMVHDGEPYIGMVFDIFQNDQEDGKEQMSHSPLHHDKATCNNIVSQNQNFLTRYELMEPLHLELGSTVKHAVDYHFIPVLADQVELMEASHDYSPVAISPEEQDVHGNVEVLGTRQHAPPARFGHDWWQWWIPWWSWDGSQDHFSNYRMNKHAFAGGSHGEGPLLHTFRLFSTT